MAPRLIVLPQVTLEDILAGTARLDVPDFIKRTLPLVGARPLFDPGPHQALLQCLFDVPLREGGDLTHFLGLYRDVGVSKPWCEIVASLRLVGWSRSSIYAESGASLPQLFTMAKGGHIERIAQTKRGDVVLRTSGRTLAVEIERRAAPAWDGEVLPPPGTIDDRVSGRLLDLVDELSARIRPTVGGAQFLGPDVTGGALRVLASTVKTVLAERWATRRRGDRIVVMPSAYRELFRALGLSEHVEVARAVLEQEAGRTGTARPIGAVLRYEGGFLQVVKRPDEASVLEHSV